VSQIFGSAFSSIIACVTKIIRTKLFPKRHHRITIQGGRLKDFDHDRL